MAEKNNSLDRIKTVLKAGVILFFIAICALIIAIITSPSSKPSLDVIIYGGVVLALFVIILTSFIIYKKKAKEND